MNDVVEVADVRVRRAPVGGLDVAGAALDPVLDVLVVDVLGRRFVEGHAHPVQRGVVDADDQRAATDHGDGRSATEALRVPDLDVAEAHVVVVAGEPQQVLLFERRLDHELDVREVLQAGIGYVHRFLQTAGCRVRAHSA